MTPDRAPICILTLLVLLLGGCGPGAAPVPAAPAPPAPPPAPATTSTPAPTSVPATASTPAPSPSGASVPSGTTTSNGGTYRVEFTLDPDPIPLNELFEIRVRIFDSANSASPLDDVELTVDGRMPEHRHGMNRTPRVERQADGSFTVTGMLFHMPGLWELHFDITRDGVTERAETDIELE